MFLCTMILQLCSIVFEIAALGVDNWNFGTKIQSAIGASL